MILLGQYIVVKRETLSTKYGNNCSQRYVFVDYLIFYVL